MAFHFVFDRRNDSRPYPNLAPEMPNPHGSYAGLGDTWPHIAPCRLLLYCEDHGYPYTIHYTDQAFPVGAWYPVGLAWFDYELDYFALIPLSTLALIQSGHVRVLFYYHEGDNPFKEQARLDALCRLHGLANSCYRFISGNTQANSIGNFCYFPDHELFYWRNGVVWNGQTQLYCPAHEEPRSRNFTLLSRVHKWWRATVVGYLHKTGCLDRAWWSYDLVHMGDLPENNPIMIGSILGLSEYLVEFLAGAPYRCDDLTAEEHNSHWILADHLYSDSYASIVLETLFDAEQSGGAFITEKTFKAVLHGHPFVIFGCVGTLATLRRLGYRTFDHVINNGYDEILDNTQRFRACMATVETLARQPDLHQWYRACRTDILHNQALFRATKYGRLAQLDQELTRA